MKAGELRHYVTIESYTSSIETDGSATKSWSTFSDRWASIKTATGREVERAKALGGQASHVIYWRRDPDYLVTPEMRVKHGTRYFQIINVSPDATELWYDKVDCREDLRNG
jgi:SPP1 family predicted phage head-tail adaptor